MNKEKKIVFIKKKKCIIALLFTFIFLTGVNIVDMSNYYLSAKQTEYSYYVVSKNDKLWNISDNFKYDMDKRDYIKLVKEINNIDDNIKPGDVIKFPNKISY
ncbi:putative membrane protein [Peptoniphilus sp. ING2-D1G]|nr:putative membrane protein [Peptoniphilus sp. ING2-D1G]